MQNGSKGFHLVWKQFQKWKLFPFDLETDPEGVSSLNTISSLEIAEADSLSSGKEVSGISLLNPRDRNATIY